jgi:PKD repeat protein
MKKLLLPILFLLLALPAMSQVLLTVSGTVTDTATGNPIPNHAVNIQTDSASGWGYYNLVYTNSNGFYADSIPLQNTVTQGTLLISTSDCQNYQHMQTFTFNLSQTNFTADFAICYSNVPCDAAFTYQQSQPLTVQFTDASVGGGNIRQWIFGDGTTSTLSNPVHQYAQPGYYTVKLYIGAAGTTCADVDIQYIYVWDSTGGGCQAAFTYSVDSANTINYVHFYDQSAGNIISWSWNFGDPASGSTNVSTLQNPTHAFTASGTYMVCLTIQGADSSCFDMTCDTIVVGYNSGCQAYFAYSYDSVNAGNLVNFTDLSTGNPNAWFWSFGDGTSSTAQNPQHIFPAPGSYPVCLTITGDSCTSTYCKTVVITDTTNNNQIYGQVIAANSFITSGMVMIFSLDSNQNYNPYVAVSIVDSMGYYFFSSVPDGQYYIYAIPILPENYLPTYYGDVLTWQTATLVVLGQPNNPYNINVIAAGDMMPGNGNINGQVNMGGLKSTSLDMVTMLLMDSEGTAIGYYKLDVQGDFTFPQLSFGTYYLRAEIPGVTSDLVTVILSADNPTATVNMTFTGNRVLGIKDELSMVTSWALYPNPVSDNLTVSLEMKEYTQAEVSIYNLSGQKSWSRSETLNVGTNRIVIPVTSLSPGLYYLKIKSADGLQLTAKFIKTK